MKFYGFGDKEKPVMLLLPGTGWNWAFNFGEVIPLLLPHFYVIAVNYDGFDENEDTVYPDIRTEAKKIEEYITQEYNGSIFAAYGCAGAGTLLGLLVFRERIHFEHAILGSSDMDKVGALVAGMQKKLIRKNVVPMVIGGQLPPAVKKRMKWSPKEYKSYLEKYYSCYTAAGNGLPFVKEESLMNQILSTLTFQLPGSIEIEGTTVHAFYAKKMGDNYLERYRQHFRNVDVRRHNYHHEELLFCHPEEWVGEVLTVCGLKEQEA